MEFVYLPIYPSIAIKENKGGNGDMKEDGEKKGDFVTRDPADWENISKIKDAG